MTTPPPVPAGGVARIQATPLAAVHAQVDGATTSKKAEPPRDPTPTLQPPAQGKCGSMVTSNVQAGVTIVGLVGFEHAKNSPVKTTATFLTIPKRHEAARTLASFENIGRRRQKHYTQRPYSSVLVASSKAARSLRCRFERRNLTRIKGRDTALPLPAKRDAGPQGPQTRYEHLGSRNRVFVKCRQEFGCFNA